jgi:predicted dehydrogenase
MKDIGVGVIGLGQGEDVLLAVHRDPASRFEVRSVCARREARAREVAERHGVAHWSTEYRAVIEREDVHVVGVYSPDHLHAEQCIAALEAGKHVICTKPLVGRSRGEGVIAECERIVALARERNLKFLVGQTMRFDPEFRAGKRLHEDGDLGRILFAEAHYVHDIRGVAAFTPWRVEAPQDLLFGGACHPIDVLRWILGDVEEVHCYGTRSGLSPEYPIEDNFLINLKFASGVIARVLAAYGLVDPPMPMMSLGLYGTQASFRGDYSDFKDGHIEIVFDKLDGKPAFSTTIPAVMEGAYGHVQAVKSYFAHFQECLERDLTPSPNALDGAKTVATASACWESIRGGAPVRVRNDF